MGRGVRRGCLRCSAWGRFAAGFAMAIFILVVRPEAATSEGYRHLSLEGRFVKWPQSAPHVPVHLTFALATRPSVDEQAINCRRVGPVDGLLERSALPLHTELPTQHARSGSQMRACSPCCPRGEALKPS